MSEMRTPVTPGAARAPSDPPPAGPEAVSTLVLGIGGAARNAAVAASVEGRLVAACEQERITRVRAQGLRPHVLPEESIGAVLAAPGCSSTDIRTYAIAERDALLPGDVPVVCLDHHFAHAVTAVLSGDVGSAAVLVCDQGGLSPVSVWRFADGRHENQHWTWSGPGLAGLYAECAGIFGFGRDGAHRLEALARLDDDRSLPFPGLAYAGGAVRVDPDWRMRVSEAVERATPAGFRSRAAVAGAFQRAVGDALVALVREIHAQAGSDVLCLGGGLFYNTYLTTRILEAGIYPRVQVAINPGNPGLAAGAAVAVSRGGDLRGPAADPFLGPQFSTEDIKAVLDNCKLTYEMPGEREMVSRTVRALRRGALVGWFQGRMEWGHRALGNRSILANPFAPYALENLNVYLKQREAYRAYGVSVLADEAGSHFHAPARSAHMEFELAPRDPRPFRILPEGARRIRVQTVDEGASLFGRLHRAFGETTGAGILVNTSFNGLHEPIVCSPRDAIRVFYGTGLDVLVLGPFMLTK